MPELSLANPFPPARLRSLLECVLKWLSQTRADWRVLGLTPLSTFLDPEKFDGRAGQLIKSSIVDLAVVSAQKDAVLRAAFISELTPFVAARFADMGVPVASCVAEADAVRRFLGSVADVCPRYSGQRFPTNHGESWLLGRLRRDMHLDIPEDERDQLSRLGLLKRFEERSQAYRIYHEVSLGHVVYSDGQPFLDLMRFRCDALLCRTDGLPILVAEFDGAGHSCVDRERRDLKRDADTLRAGLPVLRVRSTNPGLAQYALRYSDIAQHRFRRDTEFVMWFIVQAFAELNEVYRRRGKRRTELLVEQILRPDNEAEAREREDDAWGDFICDQFDLHQEQARLLDTRASPLLNKKPGVVEHLEAVRVSGNGVRAQAVLTIDDKALPISTAEFAMQLQIPDGYDCTVVDFGRLEEQAVKALLLHQVGEGRACALRRS